MAEPTKTELILDYLRSDSYKPTMTNPEILREISRIHRISLSEQHLGNVRKDFREGKYDKQIRNADIAAATVNTPTPAPAPVPAKPDDKPANSLVATMADSSFLKAFQAIEDVKTLADKYGGLDNVTLIIAEMRKLGLS